MITSILIDLNLIELNYHEITISLDKYSKRCNVLTRINEAKSICKTYFT